MITDQDKRIGTDHGSDGHGNLLEEELCSKIIKAFYDTANKYGTTFKESIFQNALIEELEKLQLKVEKQKRINIYSIDSGKILGVYIPDLIVEDKIVIEIKATSFPVERDISQQRSYLKASKYEIGYLVNFGTPRLYFKRSIYTNDRKPLLALLNKD